MNHHKFCHWIVGFALLALFLVGCGTQSVSPSVGTWSGTAEYRNANGVPRYYVVQFQVNQDGKLADDAWVLFAQAPIPPGALAQGYRTSSSAIVGNAFSAQVDVRIMTGGLTFSFYSIKTEFQGTFVSPTKLEGTFKASEDSGEQGTGKWTAEPSQSRFSVPTVAPKRPETAAPTPAPPTAAPKPTVAPKP
jgi:hypothetical protein